MVFLESVTQESSFRTLFPSAWWRGHSVPTATPRGRSVEFPSKGNVSGYACNHGSLRIGNETLRLLAMLRAFLSASPLEKRGWRVPQAPFYSHRRSFAYVIGFHLPMSSALYASIHASDTGHAEGVPTATPRGRSGSFPILREPWLHA